MLVNNEVPNPFTLPRRRASAESVVKLLLCTLVGLDIVAQHLGVRRGDHTRVDVRTGSEVVENTSRDGGDDEVERKTGGG